jgi:hypothetical protein
MSSFAAALAEALPLRRGFILDNVGRVGAVGLCRLPYEKSLDPCHRPGPTAHRLIMTGISNPRVASAAVATVTVSPLSPIIACRFAAVPHNRPCWEFG